MRLSHRLALVFSLFGAAIAGGSQYQHVRQIRREVYARTEAMASLTLEAMKGLVEIQTREGRLIELGRHFEAMLRQAGVATIVVRDAKGRRIVGRSDQGALRRTPHPGLPLNRVADGYYDVEASVSLGPRGKGTLAMGFSTAALESRLSEIGAAAARNAAMAVLAVALLGWVIGTVFGLSMEQLVPRLESLAKDSENFRPLRAPGLWAELSRLVAAFNRLGQSLREETALRHELEQEKKELSAMLVHDLKTPLTVIHSGVTLLQEQLDGEMARGNRRRRADSSNRRTFELLNLSTGRLQRMVEDVLHLSRLEEVTRMADFNPVDLAELARSCARDFDLVVKGRGQNLALEITDGLSCGVLGDEALLRRVLDNLVHNAVEHTPSGGTITVRVAAADEGRVRVSVSDSGPGVPADVREDVFRKFFQKDVKRHLGNVGLGLAFCEKAVHRHGGTIGVEDATPRGACFFFAIPGAKAA